MKRTLSLWLPPLVWMGLIFVVSAQSRLPHLEEIWLDTLLKKVGHALAYGILAWLYLRTLRGRFRRPAAAHAISLSLAALYGLSDEYHQTFVSGRNGTLWDVAVDSLGAFGAMLLEWRLQRRRALARQ